jgi:hypothetical protein
VGASDYLPNTIWAKLFLEAQGYTIGKNTFFQDNQSAMKLEQNGRASCGQKSRHIDIRYFFMKDRFKTEGINVIHCLTEQMLADFFTKPLQGKLFEKFRAVIMGRAHVDTLTADTPSPAEERVGRGTEVTGTKDKGTTGNGAAHNPWTVVARRQRTRKRGPPQSTSSGLRTI